MTITYVNDLRLSEMATGDNSGTWGTVTNTNLELIGEALGYGTEAITTNADTHASVIADGATDPVRALYVEYTGTLDSACTITISPNTVNKVCFIENGTAGSQNIIISQGSGANVTIPPGDTKAVYLNGAGSGAAVVDAFASLSVVDLKVQDDLTVTDDATIGGTLGVTGALTVTGGALLNGTTPTLTIGDAGAEDAKIVFDGNAADYHVGLDDSEDALQIGLGSALGTTPRITIRAAEVVVNDLGIDLDFRVEGDADTHALFVEGETDRVSIGSNDPPMKLTVRNGSANTDIAKFTGDGTGAGLTISTAATTRADDTVIFKASDAFGELSFLSDNTEVLRLTKDNNVVIPNSGGTLFTNTAGTSNLRLGVNAGNSIASGGNYNVVVGDEAGTALTTSVQNVAIGYQALTTEDTRGSVVAVGYRALKTQNAGAAAYNVAVGVDAGVSLTTAVSTTLVGAFAGGGATLTGASNTAIGRNAGYVLTSGASNTLVGSVAGDALTEGTVNCVLGAEALTADTLGSGSVAIGRASLEAQNFTSATTTENTAVGNQAGLSNLTGTAATFIGHYSGRFATTADATTFVGANAGRGITGTKLTGNNNTAIGTSAGLVLQGAATGNTFVGFSAGAGNTVAADNVAVGFEALLTESGGQNSVAIGPRALRVQSNGSGNKFNTAVGSNAGVAITDGGSNVCLGGQTGATLTTGGSNTLVGTSANVDTAARAGATALGAGIGTHAADNSFRVNGSGGVYNTGNTSAWNQTSDERIKKNIANSTIGLAEINQIKVRTFEYRTAEEITDSALQAYDKEQIAVVKSGTQFGCIAQELATVVPSAVIEDDRGIKVVQPDELNWHMIKAVQELSTALDAALARIATLEG